MLIRSPTADPEVMIFEPPEAPTTILAESMLKFEVPESARLPTMSMLPPALAFMEALSCIVTLAMTLFCAAPIVLPLSIVAALFIPMVEPATPYSALSEISKTPLCTVVDANAFYVVASGRVVNPRKQNGPVGAGVLVNIDLGPSEIRRRYRVVEIRA